MRRIVSTILVVAGLAIASPASASDAAGGAPSIRVDGIVLGDGDRALEARLEELAGSRIALLVGDSQEHGEESHRARLRVIRFLHERAGYNVLVLPVGIFEGVWLDRKLASGGSPAEAAATVYRVWRESGAFLEILDYARSTREADPRLELIGGLCRFHAAAKALYPPHLVEWFDGAREGLLGAPLRERLESTWGGTERLSRASAERRTTAATVAGELLERFGRARPELEAAHGRRRVELERQILLNLAAFAELERIRGGDVAADGSFGRREIARNLSWFLEHRFRGEKLVYWSGRGAEPELPTAEVVTRLEISFGP